MAVTVTPVSPISGYDRAINSYIVTITATADADTTAVVTFPSQPAGTTNWLLPFSDVIMILCTMTDAGRLSSWVGGSNIGIGPPNYVVLNKTTAVGSGNAFPQLRAQFLKGSLIR